MKENAAMMANMDTSFEDKLAEARREVEEEARARALAADERHALPHILNIHEDEMFDRKICHCFKEGATTFGAKGGSSREDVELSGVSVKAQHCVIHNSGGELSLIANHADGAEVLVNGECVMAVWLPR